MRESIFVTGASGFVGGHLLPMLLKRGYRVRALVRHSSEKNRIPKGINIVVGDLAKRGEWQSSLKGHDFLIHLAAQIAAKNQSEFRRNNVVATRNLITAARRAKIKKVVLFSSAAVSSIRRDPYSKSKEDQEKIIKKSQMRSVVIRPSMIYGPGDTKNIGWLIELVKKLPAVPLPGSGKFGRQPVYVDDICKLTIKLIKKDYGKNVFDIHGYEYITLKKMISIILANLKSKKLIFNIPISFLTFAIFIGEKTLPNPKFTVDQIRSLTSGEKFEGDDWRNIFDIIPTRFEAGIARMIKGK